jgi:5-methyltetrahydrofolate--homocysteine methyltransferase
LLIGGATTSNIHTAVKIAPNYDHPVIHVRDASKVTGVVSKLISSPERDQFISETKNQQDNLREKHYSKIKEKTYITIEEARNNAFSPVWKTTTITRPANLGVNYQRDYPLEEIAAYIDWTFFFHAWKLNGKYPSIFNDPIKGEEAKKLYDDALELLDVIIREKWLTANAAYSFFPANADGDDVLLYDENSSREVFETFNFLRNQELKTDGFPNLCLADFIAPVDSGKTDYIGAFVVTAGTGIEKHVRRLEEEHDDYKAIMLKILADRLAEAFAELLHEKVRKDFWGYASDEKLDLNNMLRENYQGIRPAPGYPACPDHSEKEKIFRLLDVENQIGVSLTENFAMYPAASVSGYYFAHPDSQYFNVGKLTSDQVNDYTKRKSLNIAAIKKLLLNNIAD